MLGLTGEIVATPKDDSLAQKDEVDPEYRQWLVAAEQKAQEDFDKTVLTLSGGALGISFAFVKDIIGERPIEHSWLLIGAWLLWALSTSAMLASFFVSRLALRRAIEKCDDGTIFCGSPGGIFTHLTRALNVSGAVLFFAGVCLMAAFVSANLVQREKPNDRQETSEQSTKQPTTASPSEKGRRVLNESSEPGVRTAPAET